MATSKKGKNFTKIEQDILHSYYREQRLILDNKNRDLKTLKKKKIAWQSVTNKYNATPSITSGPRTVEQVKKCWENMVRCEKVLDAHRKLSLWRTAEGKSSDCPQTSSSALPAAYEKIAESLGQELVLLKNDYDERIACSENEVIGLLDGSAVNGQKDGHNAVVNNALNNSDLKPTKSRQLFFRRSTKRRRPSPLPSFTMGVDDEILCIRREEHEMAKEEHRANMSKIKWETAYWRAKYKNEFGSSLPHDNEYDT